MTLEEKAALLSAYETAATKYLKASREFRTKTSNRSLQNVGVARAELGATYNTIISVAPDTDTRVELEQIYEAADRIYR